MLSQVRLRPKQDLGQSQPGRPCSDCGDLAGPTNPDGGMFGSVGQLTASRQTVDRGVCVFVCLLP